jgi:dipeptidyl aminopeptidase/acylaminoacyl peptidase
VRDELRKTLLDHSAPDEKAARERTWGTVRAAFESREPVSWPVRHARPLIALAFVAALIAAALTPPGEAVVNEVRDAIGREKTVGVPQAREALFSLPASGRLLVESRRGAWIVQADGSRRLLGRYREPAWSPHGLFVAAVGANELAALDPKGKVRWSLPRRGHVSSPAWTGTRTDTDIAYLHDRELRMVAGDGEDDRLIAANAAPIAPAWRPGADRVLAYVARPSRLRVLDAETGSELWSAPMSDPKSASLEWSRDGRRLLLEEGKRIRLFTPAGRVVRALTTPKGRFFVDAAFRPGTHAFAYTVVHPARNRGVVYGADGRQLFAGAGWFVQLAWSPDGRWLTFTWPEADEWVFLRTPGVRKIQATSNLARQFGPFAHVTGWCCAPSR